MMITLTISFYYVLLPRAQICSGSVNLPGTKHWAKSYDASSWSPGAQDLQMVSRPQCTRHGINAGGHHPIPAEYLRFHLDQCGPDRVCHQVPMVEWPYSTDPVPSNADVNSELVRPPKAFRYCVSGEKIEANTHSVNLLTRPLPPQLASSTRICVPVAVSVLIGFPRIPLIQNRPEYPRSVLR